MQHTPQHLAYICNSDTKVFKYSTRLFGVDNNIGVFAV